MDRKKIKNLALCGGGIYGYAEVGALAELEYYNAYLDIQNISGTSVGSIIATLYAVGYKPAEISEIMFGLDMEALVKGEKGMVKENIISWYNLYTKYGMYEAVDLEIELDRIIEEKTGIKNCTFEQIDKSLTIIATNLNFQNARFFNKENTPTLVISKAVRMSISFPTVITPVLFEDDLYGDGGQFINYPIIMFKDELDQTIGVTFAAHNENRDCTLKKRYPINNLYDFSLSSAVTMSRATYISQITPEFLARSIVIEITEEVSSMQFNLTNDQKHIFYHNGVKAAKDQIEDILGLDFKKKIEESLHLLPEHDLTESFEIIH
jgi:NTE family protein